MRDAEATKRRILDAASVEFADHGLAGARVDAIAERAGANKQLIYAYFGSKAKLFAAVLGRQLGTLAEEIEIDPDRLPEYAGMIFDFHLDHPELTRLLLHEALHYRDRTVPSDRHRQRRNVGKVEGVREAQERGAVEPSLDPGNLVMMIIALAAWPAATPQLARQIMGAPADPEVRARYRADVVEAVRRIVTPRQGTDEHRTAARSSRS
jgi:AcrR family transcriptional regulator